MKKLKALKRALGVLLVGLIGVNSIGFSAIAEDTDYSGNFTYTVENGVATIATFDNTVTNVTLPSEIVIDGITYKANDETLVIGQSLFRTTSSQTFSIEKLIIPKGYKAIPKYICRETVTLKCAVIEYTGDDLKFDSYGFNNCTGLEQLYIYSNSISEPSITVKTSLFKNVPSTATAYVKNNNVKVTMETLKWPGVIMIDPTLGEDSSSDVNKSALSFKINEVENFLSGIDKTKYTNIEALETELENAKTVYNNGSATQDDVNNATNLLAAAFDNVEEIVDKTVLANKIEEAEILLNNIDSSKYTGVSKLRTKLSQAKTLYNDNTATQAEVNNNVEELTSAINNVVLASTDKTSLKAALDLANAFNKDKSSVDYNNFSNFTSVLFIAQAKYNNGESTQNEIDQACADLKAAQEAVTKKSAEAQITEMNGIIDQLEALNEKDYTKDSWSAVETAITNAKSINDGLVSQYIVAIQELKTAMSNLELKPQNVEEAGEPIAIIQKNAVETTLGEFTADEAIAGTAKIKITFDCAEDVSFNKYASVEIKATVNGTESYMKFMGTDSTETAGTKGWTVELPLTNAINLGDDVKLVAYTWAWANASDYVYGITKIEYMSSEGQIFKAVTDRTLAFDELKAEIAEAELISGETYTEESYAALTAALTAAKELPENSEKADIEAAKTALETAVAGLVEKTDDSSSEPTPDSTPDSESSSDTESTPDSSSKTDEESSSKTDNSSSKTDDSNNSTTSSKTDSASSSKAGTTSNANSGANGSSNPNTGAASATAAGIILLSAIGVIFSKRK